MTSLFLVVFFSYFLGNVFPSLLLSRVRGYGDVRHKGSGNLGASNVWRSGHKLDGVLTFFGDAAKGFLSLMIAYAIEPSSFILGCASISVLIGHIWPVSLGFKGGKGVATFFGILAFYAWPLALAFMIFWALICALSRTASWASLIVALMAPFLFGVLLDAGVGIWVGCMSFLIIIAHKDNILRLMHHKEHTVS